MQSPWRKTMIVQLADRFPFTPNSEQHLARLWKTSGTLQSVYIGKGHYLIKFQSADDYFVALVGGPWILFNSYILIQQWRPKFIPSDKPPKRFCIWIRLPKLPTEYYELDALFQIRKKYGRPIKVDSHTHLKAKGCFARICVEINTSQPLPQAIVVDNFLQPIAYEFQMAFCIKCGIIGQWVLTAFPNRMRLTLTTQ
ncbi:hypothetical protein Salat_1454100 [Sesamum alatum]|uniref:DUF4283 domain-containing protein n=1 Tax=Sesamum alatum TaxID=300844 RepID=A0AAE1YC37_9LAMI|nr:hypothetical protein Salat_1454100 [Sesamum alatum]